MPYNHLVPGAGFEPARTAALPFSSLIEPRLATFAIPDYAGTCRQFDILYLLRRLMSSFPRVGDTHRNAH